MKISKRVFKTKFATIFITFALFFNLFLGINYSFTQDQNNDDGTDESLRMSQVQLPDKVYTFFAPSYTLIFENLSLQDCYLHYIWIELVTPHDISTMRIRIWDPEGTQYNVFESEMFWDPEYGRYFEIPFGIALSGNYTLEFYVETSKNVNILIYIEQGPKCLHDKLDWQDIGKIIFYEVRKFNNTMNIEHEIFLHTDMMYKFYFARVSAISIKEDNSVKADIYIIDSLGTEFEMWNNRSLQNIDGLNGFCFGTSVDGIHSFKITVYCQVDYVNIALAVVKDYTIGGAIDPNQTDPDPIPTNTSNIANVSISVPIEWTIGTIVFIGVLWGIPIFIVIYRRKKNDTGLNFKTRNPK